MNKPRVLIIGLGLIGGSLALALSRRGAATVYGADADPASVSAALADGAVASGGDASALAPEADFIFICTPAPAVAGVMSSLTPLARPGCIFCDCASVKRSVIKEVDALPGDFRFVGGHPMAGAEKSGYSAATETLLENAYFVLTPCTRSDEAALKALSSLISSAGALPVVLGPEAHDEAVGLTSHLPHVLASALVNMLGDAGADSARLAAGGFRDLTRIASSDPAMWRTITMANSRVLSELIGRYCERLHIFHTLLESGDAEGIEVFFAKAREGRDALNSRLQSLIPKAHEIFVDVADRPGMISEVASVISSEGINIKNINIRNNREEGGGVMTVLLESAAAAEGALSALRRSGIRAAAKE